MKAQEFASSLVPAALALVACVAQPADGGAATSSVQGQRLIVRTAADWPSATAFAQRAAEVAGVPVRDVSVIAPGQFSLLLVCDDATICQGAVQRLSGERAFLVDVQADQRRRLPPRPGTNQTQ